MAQAHLTKENFKESWDDAKTYMSPLFAPLAEFERIARNRPHPGINPAYPKNTDGTLAAIIQEQPKRTIQQIPTGQVETGQNTVKSYVANFVLTEQILPNANAQADVLQKSWGIMGKALTFGSYGSMTYFGESNGVTGANFKLFYIKDGFFERGKLTFADCNKFFVRMWYQPSDLDVLIESQKANKARDPEYKGKWKVDKLELLKEEVRKKHDEEKTAGEKERNKEAEAIEIIMGFQKGIDASFYAFSPSLGMEEDDCLGEFPNDDPRGEMPIQYLYANIDFENPLGRGVVELSGGTQNVIDSMLQSYQYNRAMQLAPVLIKRGTWDKSKAKLKPNALIDLGTNPDNSLETLKLDTSALNNFSGDFGLFKSQVLALNNNGDTSTSSEVGNPGMSKTTAGVNLQQLKLGVSDNYMRKQYEQWFADVCESMLNKHFANKHGKEELVLDDDTARKVLAEDPEAVDENNVYIIDWDEYQELKFKVDASTSDKASTQAQLEALDSFWERASNNPFIQSILQQYPDKAVEAYNQYLALTGVEDQEKLQIDVEQFKADQEERQLQEQQMAMQQGMEQPPIDGEVVEPEMQQLPEELPSEDMPVEEPVVDESMPIEDELGEEELPLEIEPEPVEEVPVEEMVTEEQILEDGVINEADMAGLDEEEIELIEGLMERNIDQEVIASAIVMLREGVPEEEVAEIVALSLEEAV